MPLTSATDPKFLGTMETWLRDQPEILILVRYSHAGGQREFEFHSSFQALSEKIRRLRPLTSIIAFKLPQLQHRGVVDDSLIDKCLSNIPNGLEYLIVEEVRRTAGRHTWQHHDSGMSHAELRDDLEESRGVLVRAGLYPPWLVDDEEVISAIVPDEHGVVRSGVY
jgi:hypothetical protein